MSLIPYGLFSRCMLVAVAFSAVLAVSLPSSTGVRQRQPAIQTPSAKDDGWKVGNPSDAGMDSVRLSNFLRRINEGEYDGIDGILIVKDGRIVFENYFRGNDFDYTAKDFKGRMVDYDANTIHNLASVTKSITAILFGIAVDKGYVKSVDDKLFAYFPEDSALFVGSKRNIALWHLLTMSSGLKWNEQDVSYGNLSNDVVQLFIVPDPLKYILSKPMANEPGTAWYYNGGGTNLIGQVVQRKSGMRLDRFAQENLFDPLGVAASKWVYINDNFVYASGDLRLSLRDMAKIGMLVLDHGEWNGKRVVSSKWIDEMTTKRVWLPKGDGYGYQWWLQTYGLGKDSINSFHAGGWGGQWIIVLPGLNAVVVFTGRNYAAPDVTNDMMFNYVLPSMDRDFIYDFDAISREAPLPDSITTILPDTVGSLFPGLSGRWYGQWDAHFLSCQLLVREVSGDSATVFYSYADHPDGYFKKGWVKRCVKIDPSGRIRVQTSDSLDFRYDKSENVVVANLKNAYVTSKAILRRAH